MTHLALARLETAGRLKVLITQNIDNFHYRAGSRSIVEFHGNSRLLVCLKCHQRVEARPELLETLPPRCHCGGIYKPDFIFFGEGIPPEAQTRAREAAASTEVMLVVGSTGEVYPAALVPRWAKEANAKTEGASRTLAGSCCSVDGVKVTLLRSPGMTRAANFDLPARILAEAERVVIASGYQGINMRRLAGKVCVSATAIYHYFESKEAILRKLRIRAAEKLNDRIRAIDSRLPPHQFVEELGRQYLAYAQENLNLYRLLFEAPFDERVETKDHPVLYFTYLARD